jgi:hypothetical protein
MKKVLLFATAVLLCLSSFAQNMRINATQGKATVRATNSFSETNYAAKSTAWTSDSFFYKYVYHDDTMSIVNAFDSSKIFICDFADPADSGLYFGTNVYNMTAWGNYFSYHYGGDTMMKILGVMSAWSGTLTPTSSKTINFKVWKADTTHVLQSGHLYVNNLPGAQLYTQSASVLDLGIGMGADPDTINKITWFTTPVSGVNSPFVLGWDMSYQFGALGGDTIGMRSTDTIGKGSGWATVTGGDTIVHAQTMVKIGSTWYDIWLNGGQKKFNLSIVPIVQISSATASTASITREDLTFFGTYPNPASNATNVKFSLERQSNVAINIMDINGRIIRSISESNLGAGEHVIPVSTAELAAGTYVVSLQTSIGGNIAAQITVVK